MRITFQDITIKNFFSVGNSPLKINFLMSKTTAVLGKNGEGKSSCILDSVHFALFGKPFRNINIPNVVNSINQKDCLVELNILVGKRQVHIRRGLKPKIFEIYIDGQMLDQDASFKDYQQYFETQILGGMNDSVFRQVVVIGSADYKPFMQLTAAARRDFIEGLLDITVFSNMMQIGKEKISSLKEVLLDIDNKIEIIEEKIKIHQSNTERLLNDNDTKRKQIERSIEKEEEDIEKLSLKVEELQKEKDTLIQKIEKNDTVEQYKLSLLKSISKHDNTINKSNETMLFFENHSSCPTCKQNIQEDHKCSIIKEHTDVISNTNREMQKDEEQLKKVEKLLSDYKKIQKEISRIENDIHQTQSVITSKNSLIKTYNKNIKLINKSDKVSTVDIDNLNRELNDNKNLRLKYIDEKNYLDIACNLLKDGGIKTKIIQNFIPLINKYVNLYLDKFGLPIEFTFDDMFNEVIKSRYRDKFQYNNFSEGEKQRIDLAILLTWRHIAKSKNTVNTNLLIFDEVFDKSLDTSATEALLDILLDMDDKQNIFVISHKSDLSSKMDKTLRFEKVKNFTKVV